MNAKSPDPPDNGGNPGSWPLGQTEEDQSKAGDRERPYREIQHAADGASKRVPNSLKGLGQQVVHGSVLLRAGNVPADRLRGFG